MKRIFLIFTFIASLVINSIALAQDWEDGYDPNTEIAIRGRVVEIIANERGPTIIGVTRGDRVYNVFTAPRWYMESEKVDLKINDEIVVHGAKFFSKKGELSIIARSIHNISSGKLYKFREDVNLKPIWRKKNDRKKRKDF